MCGQYKCKAIFMLLYCMYVSVDVGGVIKHFMADSAGLRSGCKR